MKFQQRSSEIIEVHEAKNLPKMLTEKVMELRGLPFYTFYDHVTIKDIENGAFSKETVPYWILNTLN